MTNCKVGDLAVVRPPKSVGWCSATGKMVEIVRVVGVGVVVAPDGVKWEAAPGVGNRVDWLVKFQRPEAMVAKNGRIFTTFYDVIPDSRLIPIRDQPGEDETLEWAGLPAGHEVVA